MSKCVVMFACLAALDADCGTVEIDSLLDAGILAHQNALAIIEDRRAEMETELESAGDGDGHARKQDVELTGLKRRQALWRRGRGELHFPRVAEHGDGQRPAATDEEALPATAGTGREETGRRADADLDGATPIDAVEGRACIGGPGWEPCSKPDDDAGHGRQQKAQAMCNLPAISPHPCKRRNGSTCPLCGKTLACPPGRQRLVICCGACPP